MDVLLVLFVIAWGYLLYKSLNPSTVSTPTSKSISTKRALLIGINYFDSPFELAGCNNDSKDIFTLLTQHLGYDPNNITLLLDENTSYIQPTRENILRELEIKVRQTQPGDTLVICYSGHGDTVRCLLGDEADGLDETIVPVDFRQKGQITDDRIREALCKLPEGSYVFMLSDSCHSGTICDLRYNFDVVPTFIRGRRVDQERISVDNHYPDTAADIVLLSGCRDNQSSADSNEDGHPRGALTWSFLKTMSQDNYKPTLFQLLEQVRENLRNKGYDQIPQISSGRRVASSDIVRI